MIRFEIEEDIDYWETMYQEKYKGSKYKKCSKNFSNKIVGKPVENPHIYIIPRQRGGPSYKNVLLEFDEPKDIQFCPISKGYSMQDVCSFTLGPVENHSLNIVNCAFSKCIAISHIDGTGKFNLNSKKYWKKIRKNPLRKIINLSDTTMSIDGEIVNKEKWLEDNIDLWFHDWKRWHDAIRFGSEGSIDWTNGSEILLYCNCIDYSGYNKYMDFVTWKKKCFIEPSYNLFKKENRVIKFLKMLYFDNKISIGLVHPKGSTDKIIKALTPENISDKYNSPHEMISMPYVIAGYLLDVPISF